MIVQYDMATGQRIEESQSAQESREIGRSPAAIPGLQMIDDTGLDRHAGRRALPADLLDVPVDLFLAEQYRRR